MAKVKHLIALHFFLTFLYPLAAQEYRVHYRHDENDSAKLDGRLSLQNVFTDRTSALSYINGLPAQLKNSGFLAASIDEIRADSAEAFVVLYLGERYEWAAITPDSAAAAIMQAIRVPGEVFRGAVDFNTLNTWQQRILDHLEEYGHPFGRVFLDSITISGNRVDALLRVNPGPLYRIDSIRVYGDAKVSNEFLQRHLQLHNGSLYNKKKLLSISSRIAELTYVQEEKPFDLSLLGTGSVLNLYLKNRKSSQVNALIGFLPNSDQAADKKFVITADVNILLRNSLSNGETIGLVWQQLQQKSPRLNLLFEQPFIMRSAFGVRFAFDMFRKDSSFLNINLHLGTTYRIGDRKSASVFLQRFQTIVNQVNEAQVIQTRTLPREADVQSLNLGVGYQYISTDYRFNPRKGNELSITASAGNKTIKRNNQVMELKDPADPAFKFSSLYDSVRLKAYQMRATIAAARFFPVGRQSAFKTAVHVGMFQSANFFRNELFMIGGNRLLRGFDEESQYVSQYAIGTMEYRYLLGQNSAFFVFADGGYGKHEMEQEKHHTYIGTGSGLSFETKAGIFNIVWAVGRRDDTGFNLRQSKLHFGFVSYF